MENDKKDKLPNFNININPVVYPKTKTPNDKIKEKEVKMEEKPDEVVRIMTSNDNKNEKNVESTNNLAENENKDKSITQTTNIKDAILETINSCGFSKEIIYEESDQNNGMRIIKVIKVMGRVSKKQESDFFKFKSNLYEKLITLFGENFVKLNFNHIFKVECGLLVGDILPNFEVFDIEGKKKSLLSEGDVTYINVWSVIDSASQEQLREDIDLFSNSMNEKIFDEKKIKVVSISNESLLIRWKNYVVSNGYDCVPQYFKPDILELIGIKSFPCSLIIDKKGAIIYLGNCENLDIKESLINVSEDKDIIFMKKTEENEGSDNLWFDELDESTRADIIQNTNIILKESNVSNVAFTFHTKRVYSFQKQKTTCIPVFNGIVTPDEFEIVQTLAINLQTDFNINNFQFNLRVLSGEYGY